MAWQVEYETNEKGEGLEAHAAAFAQGLKRSGDQAQVALALEHAKPLVAAVGATKFRAVLSGHVPEEGDKVYLPTALSVSVVKTDPPPKPKSPVASGRP
jgi:hypothetical protein